ncbi:hypothetical protein [Yersinia ruckeri]|uniref:hypothetical protein n=1 Tax=Yersinia ruckeri TaxID=29486 RepID=UPI002238B300|nr:hypothetical protein [Yersinia ruckeri]MCW6598857.1 hypothetical protein [Yersinia ruckeri]
MTAIIKKKDSIGLRVRHVTQSPLRKRMALQAAHRRASSKMVPVPLNPQVLVANVTAEQLSASVKFADEFNRNYKPEEGASLFVEA